MKARIHVFYKDSVFDPQGNTVAQSLQTLGFSNVKNVRMGKVIDVELEDGPKEAMDSEVEKMCDILLVNPTIESFKYEYPKEEGK